MKMACGPKRLVRLWNNYLPLILIVAASLIGGSCLAQFPSTDSLRKYNNRYINNSPVEAFANKRLNTLLHGIINWVDSARAGEGGTLGIDQIQAVNDSTFRYRLDGVYTSVALKGVYDNRTKIERVYGYDDTTLAVVSNGSGGRDTTFISKGTGVAGTEGVSQNYVDSLFATLTENVVYLGDLMTSNGTEFDNPANPDTAVISTKSYVDLNIARDSIGRVGDSIRLYRNGVHLSSVMTTSFI